MKIGYKICLVIIIALLIVTSTLATSYSLWTVTETQSDNNNIVAGCFELDFNDLDSNNESTSINLNNTYPISNQSGLRLTPYVLQIENTCSVAASYKLVLNDLLSNTLDISNINYSLSYSGVNYGPANIGSITPYSLDEGIKETIEEEKNVQIKNSYVLATGVLNPNEAATYELRLWVKEEATDVMEKEFIAIVSHEAYATNPHS